MTEGPRKRSRFDVGADSRKPRHDEESRRRSRSPASDSRSRDSRRRSRSPSANDKSAGDDPAKAALAASASAKAAEAAAKIRAQIEAKRAAGELRASSAPKPVIKLDSGAGTDQGSSSNDDGIYERDGDFIWDKEVNDLRNRYTLTKGPTHKMIMEKTGADVTTRGAYYPDKAMATPGNPPLYLHVTSQTREGLQQAIDIINKMIDEPLQELVDERRFGPRRQPEVERDERGRRKWPEAKIPIPLEPIFGFNLRAQVVGQQGMYVKHIQQEAGGARVQIKGQGSGFFEHGTNEESDEPMYLHVAAASQEQVDHAVTLCNSLLERVTEDYNEFKSRGGHLRGDRGRDGGNGRRDGGHGGRDGGYGGRDGGGHDQQGGGGQQQYGQYPAAQVAMGPELQAWKPYYDWEFSNPPEFQAYMQANPAVASGYAMARPYLVQTGIDPYGGQAQGQAAGYGAAAPGAAQGYGYGNAASPPPPAPGANDAAPPPPGQGSGGYGYNAMPPPPGL